MNCICILSFLNYYYLKTIYFFFFFLLMLLLLLFILILLLLLLIIIIIIIIIIVIKIIIICFYFQKMEHTHRDTFCGLIKTLESIKQGLSWPGKGRAPLRDVSEVPVVFREPYVTSGYRAPNQPWRYYLLSAFQLHNESVNVWTHLLAGLAVIAQLCRLSRLMDMTRHKDAATLVAFSVGCVLNALLSATAHLLHSKSAWWHYVWFLIDYAGVTYNSFATVLGCVYVSSHPLVYDVIEPYVLPANIALSVFGFVTCCLAKLRFSDPYQTKRKCIMVAALGLHALVGAVPLMARYVQCANDQHCSLSSLNHITIIFFLLAACAVSFSAHVPERLWHGKFDLFGQGHQIFHVFTAITMVMELEGMYIDIQNGASAHTTPNLTKMLTAYLILILIHIGILVALKTYVRDKVKGELKERTE